ncbi:MAG: hypothetical protein U9R79_02185 [Armatimonadota bacterium]|nr:hypothetical protein [Armatimonadota bacterium]
MMADVKALLDCLKAEHREFLERRAGERETTIEQELERVVDLAMALDAPDSVQVTYNPRTGVVCRIPRNPTSLTDFAGMITDPEAAGKDVHDLLYGEEADR